MRQNHGIFTAACLVAFGLQLGCSSSATPGTEGPSTACAYSTNTSGDAEIGIGCETDDQCMSGKCLLAGENGNITNNIFGFCTRACNCNDNPEISIATEAPGVSCVFPGGCYPDQGFSRYRHAVPKCNSVSDCTAIDSRYNVCATTDSSTVVEKTCGHLRKVCQAHE